MKAPDTYRLHFPATGKVIDFGSRGSAAINEWGVWRKMGKNPVFVGPGVEIKVGCLLTQEGKTGTVETR